MVTKITKTTAKKLHPVSKLDYELAAWQAEKVVCGVDEVGRGCLAGPVVAAAVIFPIGAKIDNICDSKLLQEKELLDLAQKIMQNAWCGFGIINPFLIDNCNIRQATIFAMCRAVENLLTICPIKPHKILIDDLPLDQYLARDVDCLSAPKGETWSYSIAAASIVAKVKRDQLMCDYNQIFNGFGFNHHKGYGTTEHYENILQQERSILHRNSFLKKFQISINGDKQCKLF